MIVVRYCIEYNWPNNFGDGINPMVYKFFTKRNIISKSIFDTDYKDYNSKDTILGFGSILQYAHENDIIFGSGILDLNRSMKVEPKQIISVRGPLTRNFLLEYNIDCPEVYGDTALLLPFIYFPKVEKKYKLGIIPHYIDKYKISDYEFDDSVLIIDIQSSHVYEKFISELLSCECIISSSLHGVIVSDAYGIPSYVCKLDKLDVNNVKFHDYYLSVNREYYTITFDVNIDNMIKQMKPYKCSINIRQLIELFPFIDEIVKEDCLRKLDEGFLDYLC